MLCAVLLALLHGCTESVESDQQPATSNSGYVDLIATALTEAIVEVGGEWTQGGRTIVLEREPLARMYPTDPDTGPRQGDVRIAFTQVARSMGLSTEEGLQDDFMWCEDRPGVGADCEMDEDIMLIAPGQPRALADGTWQLIFSTKNMVAEGRRAWRTHVMIFQSSQVGWSKTFHGVGWVN